MSIHITNVSLLGGGGLPLAATASGVFRYPLHRVEPIEAYVNSYRNNKKGYLRLFKMKKMRLCRYLMSIVIYISKKERKFVLVDKIKGDGSPMNDFENMKSKVKQFTVDRDWDQFHNGKDLAIALSGEAGELLNAFLWKKPEDVKIEKVREELADVLNYAFLIADKYNLDIEEIMDEKLRINGEKYPVDKAKGSAKKYNEF